jgi:hypothetical protein
MPGDGHFPWLFGMLVLSMTPSLFYQLPAVSFDPIYDVPEFHLCEN